MKKNTKSIVLLITLMLMVCLMGCSNAATQSEETAQPETQVTVEEETTEVEESEVVPEEVVAEEPEEVVTEEPTQPEEVEEPVATDEPVEVISIKEHADLTNYIATLDPDQPEIIIFNGVELYMIHMKEGQHYQLKPDDEIIVNREGSLIGCGWNLDLGDTSMSIDNYNILKVDYSKFEQNQEFFFIKEQANGEDARRTCYFDPPTE